MRRFLSLTIYVSLAVSCPAADWAQTHEQGVVAIQHREFTQAEALFRQSLDVAETQMHKAISANDLGVTLHLMRRDADSAHWLEQASELWPKDGSRLVERVQTAQVLGAVYRIAGKYELSENVLRGALALNAPDPDSVAALLNELGDLMREVGRAPDARDAFSRAEQLNSSSLQSRFQTLTGSADVAREMHLWNASAERWGKALEIARSQHWDALEAVALRGMADNFLDQGNAVQAEPLLRKALAFFETTPGAAQQVAYTLRSLAQLYLAGNKLALGEESLHRAVAAEEQSLGVNHPQVAVLLEMLGDSVSRRGDMTGARDYFDRATSIMAAAFGGRSPITAAVRASWAIVEQRAGRSAAAAADFESALEVLNTVGPNAQGLRLSVLQHYAESLQAAHRKKDATAVRLLVKAAFASAGANR